MIRTQNFKGGREIVKRICNEVLKLKMQKREVLQVLVHDLKNGLSLYREFFQESVCWFDEEHDLFMKNTRLIAGAMSMLSPDVYKRQHLYRGDASDHSGRAQKKFS